MLAGCLFFLALAQVFSGCTRSPEGSGEPMDTEPAEGNHAALGFEIIHQEQYSVLRVRNPWQGARDVIFEYYLVPSGDPLPAGLDRERVIRTPVSRVVCFSTTQLAMIDFLGEGNEIVGSSGVHFICSPGLQERVKAGQIREIGYDQGLSYETLLDLQPDLVLAYGVSGAVNQEVARMEEFGLPVVLTAEYLEPHPLGKAEWIRFMGMFFNREQEADSLYREISRNYRRLASSTDSLSGRPSVMLGLPWKDSWYVSAAGSFAATLIRDAGGRYIWDDVPGHESIPMDLEKVYFRCRDAAYWLNPGAATRIGQIREVDPRLGDLNPVREGKVYNNNARLSRGGGNDYWESGTVRPDRILADLIRILHPGLLPGDSLYYYRKLD